MNIRYKDIAAELGVSPSTVSMVINGKPGINAQTRRRVLRALESAGLEPKVQTVAEKSGYIRFLKYKKYGKVINDHGFISAMTDGINLKARDLGYEVLISSCDENNIAAEINSILADPKEGIILLGTELMGDDLTRFSCFNVPIVIVDSYFEFENYDCVTMNNFDVAGTVVKFLYEKGYRTIGHFRSSFTINNFIGRREGYLKALEKLHLKYDPAFTFSLDCTMEGAYHDFRAILKKRPKLPEAIFSDNDTIAIGAIKALHEFNIKIPDDIAIVGVDDLPFCVMTEPKLTTVAIHKQEMGMLAVQRLVEKIRTQDGLVIKQQVGAKIVERNSTG